MNSRVQFDARKNPAPSSRQHGLRLAVPSTTPAVCIEPHRDDAESQAVRGTTLQAQTQLPPHATPQRAATGGETTTNSNRLLTVHEVAELLQVPVSWIYGRTRKRSCERLPGYRLGKYWRFDPDEVLEWVSRQKATREPA